MMHCPICSATLHTAAEMIESKRRREPYPPDSYAPLHMKAWHQRGDGPASLWTSTPGHLAGRKGGKWGRH